MYPCKREKPALQITGFWVEAEPQAILNPNPKPRTLEDLPGPAAKAKLLLCRSSYSPHSTRSLAMLRGSREAARPWEPAWSDLFGWSPVSGKVWAID